MAGLPIPQESVIRQQSQRLARAIDIYQPSANCSCRRVSDVLEHLLGKAYPAGQQRKDTIHLQVRFSADGAKLSKLKDSVRGVLKLVPPRPTGPTTISMLPEDEHTLFLYIGAENRDCLMEHGRTTFNEMARIAADGLSVNGTKFQIQWLLCADWKAMALLKGISAPNAEFFCLWCKCTKNQIRDFSYPDWAISRCANEQKDLLTLPRATDRKGYSKQDLLPFICYQNVIPDELHLRMRITNKLLNQVVRWSIETKTTQELLSEMKRIHVDFKLFEEVGDDDHGKIRKWTQPSGDHLWKVLNNLNLVAVLGDGKLRKKEQNVGNLTLAVLKAQLQVRQLPTTGKKDDLVRRLSDALRSGEKLTNIRPATVTSYDFDDEDNMLLLACDGDPEEDLVDVRELAEVWAEFARLMKALRAAPGTEGYMSPDQFKTATTSWAKLFKRATFVEDVIPYIHCLVYHVPQALAKFTFLPDIGCSQVERKNYDQRCAYFSATSRDGGKGRTSVTKQILERENIALVFSSEADEEVQLSKTGRKRRRTPKQLSFTNA